MSIYNAYPSRYREAVLSKRVVLSPFSHWNCADEEIVLAQLGELIVIGTKDAKITALLLINSIQRVIFMLLQLNANAMNVRIRNLLCMNLLTIPDWAGRNELPSICLAFHF